MTREVIVSTVPFTAIWPPLVMVQLLPLASMIAAVEPARTTVSFGEAATAAVTVTAVLPEPLVLPEVALNAMLSEPAEAPAV